MHRPFTFNKFTSRSRSGSEPEAIDPKAASPLSKPTWLFTEPLLQKHRLNSTCSTTSGGPLLSSHNKGRAQLFSNPGNSLPIPRSGRARLVSLNTGYSVSPSYGSHLSTKDLIRNETAMVISRKLNTVLSDLGLNKPIPIKSGPRSKFRLDSKTVHMYVANNTDCVYLPSSLSASSTYDEAENGIDPQVEPIVEDPPEHLASDLAPAELLDKMGKVMLPNYLVGNPDLQNPIPHTFAVIIELTKDVAGFKDLCFELLSLVHILWPPLDVNSRPLIPENFCIGRMEWLPRLEDADYFISATNSTDSRVRHVTPQDLARRTREYSLIYPKDDPSRAQPLALAPPAHPFPALASSTGSGSSNISHLQTDTAAEGVYVFILPVILPLQLPAALDTINGNLVHNLDVSFSKTGDFMARKLKVGATYDLPVVRHPPPFAELIADKPVFISRCWSEALHYTIELPKKFVLLGQEHVATMRLVPMIKDVVVKRIRFNVLERITYALQLMHRQYEYDLADHRAKPGSKKQPRPERVVPIFELVTKMRLRLLLTEPYRLETIECPANNILHSCYAPDDSSRGEQRSVATPLEIKVSLPFLTTSADKYGVPEEPDLPSLALQYFRNHQHPDSHRNRHSVVSVVNDLVRKNSVDFTGSDECCFPLAQDNIKDGTTVLERALAPDSNFRHIQVSHRLQVCFRISRPDPEVEGKLRHYEVVVDTPIVLVSSKCSADATQLPEYVQELHVPGGSEPGTISRDGVIIRPYTEFGMGEQLPSFQEAISPSSSPCRPSPFNSPALPHMTSPRDPAPAYSFSEAGDIDDECAVFDEDDDDDESDGPMAHSPRSLPTNDIDFSVCDSQGVKRALARSFSRSTRDQFSSTDEQSQLLADITEGAGHLSPGLAGMRKLLLSESDGVPHIVPVKHNRILGDSLDSGSAESVGASACMERVPSHGTGASSLGKAASEGSGSSGLFISSYAIA